MNALFTQTTTAGETIAAGGVLVTPESSVHTLRLPFGAFVWNRPSRVVVERGGHVVERLRIVDATRMAQVALGLAVLVELFIQRKGVPR